MTSTALDDKKQLRKKLKNIRETISEKEHKVKSEMATKKLLTIIDPAPHKIGVFLPLGDEIDTYPLIHKLHSQNHIIGLPVTGKHATPLIFRQYTPGDILVEGLFKTQEPHSDSPKIIPSTLIIPLLGFDMNCWRLGYGGGYYDATIKKIRQIHDVHTIGFAFEDQKVGNIPHEDHDMQLDLIITDIDIYNSLNK